MNAKCKRVTKLPRKQRSELSILFSPLVWIGPAFSAGAEIAGHPKSIQRFTAAEPPPVLRLPFMRSTAADFMRGVAALRVTFVSPPNVDAIAFFFHCKTPHAEKWYWGIPSQRGIEMTSQHAGPAGKLPRERPLAKTRLEAKQIPVWILNQELVNPNLNSIPAIPLFFRLHEERPSDLRQIIKKRAQFRHLNLEIHPSAQGRLERRGDPLPAITELFKHDLGAIEVQIYKALFISTIGNGKAAEIYPKPFTRRHVADDQFRHKLRTTKFQVQPLRKQLRDLLASYPRDRQGDEMTGSNTRVQAEQRRRRLRCYPWWWVMEFRSIR